MELLGGDWSLGHDWCAAAQVDRESRRGRRSLLGRSWSGRLTDRGRGLLHGRLPDRGRGLLHGRLTDRGRGLLHGRLTHRSWNLLHGRDRLLGHGSLRGGSL
ncbi:hypothetical protein ACIQCV_15710 [Dietzia maris]